MYSNYEIIGIAICCIIFVIFYFVDKIKVKKDE